MSSSSKTQKKGAEFLCKVRYKNTLPDLPFGPKLLPTGDASDYAIFKYTDWMKSIPYPLTFPGDLGMPLDFVDLQGPQIMDNPIIEDEDIILLEPYKEQTSESNGVKMPMVSWLRRTEYISTEASSFRQRKNETVDEKRIKQRLKENPEIFATDRESQIKAIEKGFQEIQDTENNIIHPLNPNLKAVEVYPVFPDYDMWSQVFAQCSFDDDPAAGLKGSVDENKAEDLKRRSIMTAFDVDGKDVMVYYLPKDKGSNPMLIDGEEAEDEAELYEYTRQLEFVPVREEGKLFFVIDPERKIATYNKVDLTLNLKRKREKRKAQGANGSSQHDSSAAIPSILSVTRREKTEEEKERYENVMRSFTNPDLSDAEASHESMDEY